MDSNGGLNTPPSSHASAHKCTICSKAFSRHTDLRRHKDAVHLKINAGTSSARTAENHSRRKLTSNAHEQPLRQRAVRMPGQMWTLTFPRPVQSGHHEYEENALLLGSNIQKAVEGLIDWRSPGGGGSFKRKDALKSHIFHCHRAKAFTYTDEQLSNKMTRARFNQVFLRPAIELVKLVAALRDTSLMRITKNPGSASEESDKPVAVFSGALLATAAAPSHDDDDFVEVEESGTTLDSNQTSGPSEHHEQDGVTMKAERSPSPLGQWVRAREAQKALSHPPSDADHSLQKRHAVSSCALSPSKRSISTFSSTVFTIAVGTDRRCTSPRSNRVASNSQTSQTNTPFPTMTSPIGISMNGNVLGLDFGGSGGRNNEGLSYFSSTSVAPIPAFPTQPTVDPTKQYYRRVVSLPVGSHEQGFFSSPPSLMGSPALSPAAQQSVDVNTTTLGGLSPSSRDVMDPSLLDDEITI